MSEKRRIRIGIDVGGTFTDAVAVDQDDFSVICNIKTPTTHSAEEGVARGVVDSLLTLLEQGNISPDEISFIAHGTTQATNALLEGDVEKVGIIGMGVGIEGVKAKADTNIGNVEVSNGKLLYTESTFLDPSKSMDGDPLITDLLNKDCKVIVASEAFSVDDPTNELKILDLCAKRDVLATGGHEISKLYGLKSRTHTAVINASILPKMLKTADMTQQAVDKAGIQTPLMIMRCDGGVMKVDEVKKRPILTILSGPAAGVAGALMYERVSDGIFLEVGGTSTDISAIKNGKVMVDYAEIGGHKTYVTSLDVNTVGIGGGSMVAVANKSIVTTGPRSAHIAKCGYCTYAPSADIIRGGTLELIKPLPGDRDDYATIVGTDGKRYAITLSCAANYAGYVKEGDYAYGNYEAAAAGIEKLAEYTGESPDTVAKKIVDFAAEKNAAAVQTLIKKYDLDPNMIVFTGGGGGASTVIWPLSEKMGIRAQLAKNAPIISTIGAALAMVRDVVERTIIDPTEEDILKVRAEAEQLAIRSGAKPETIEVNVEIDATANRVRAIAIGTTELVRKTLGVGELSAEKILEEAAKSLAVEPERMEELAKNDSFTIFRQKPAKKTFASFFKKQTLYTCVIDNKGIVKYKLPDVETEAVSAKVLKEQTLPILKKYAFYDESGERTPDVYLIVRGKVIDLKGIPTIEQLASLIYADVKLLDDDLPLILIAKERK